MASYKFLVAPALVLGLAACNGTPTNGRIPGSVYQLEQLNMATARGSAFTQALTANYRVVAQEEKDEYDWTAQQIFAKKGLAAAAGNAPPPEELSQWSVADRAALSDLQTARGRLTTMLGGDAPTRFPQWAADAQTNFDCWLHEQHEGWEFDAIAKCRAGYMTAMEMIHAPAKMEPVAVKKPAPAMEPTTYMVFFDFDRSDLSPEGRTIVTSAAKAIAAGHPARIRIDGYTDTSGSNAYNNELSLRRGASVMRELIIHGVEADAIAVNGRGEDGLLQATADGVREPQNRRATIELMGR